jgi:hypothetical protein
MNKCLTLVHLTRRLGLMTTMVLNRGVTAENLALHVRKRGLESVDEIRDVLIEPAASAV